MNFSHWWNFCRQKRERSSCLCRIIVTLATIDPHFQLSIFFDHRSFSTIDHIRLSIESRSLLSISSCQKLIFIINNRLSLFLCLSPLSLLAPLSSISVPPSVINIISNRGRSRVSRPGEAIQSQRWRNECLQLFGVL